MLDSKQIFCVTTGNVCTT